MEIQRISTTTKNHFHIEDITIPTNKLEEEIDPVMDGELKLELGKAEGSKNFPEL